MGGSVSGNKSKSSSSGSSKQEVWGPQGDALQDLYGQAQGLFDQMGQYTGNLNSQAGQLAPYMQNIMGGAMGGYQDQLGGGSIGDTSDIRNMLMDSMRSQAGGSQMGKMYESILGGQGNTYIDPMVDAMKQSGMENLSRMQSGTGLDASAMGQGGSNRHAMQNAMQSRAMNSDMQNRESMMRGAAYDKDLQLKMDIAKQADAGIANTQQNLMGMLGGADRNQQAGMGYGQSMQNLGMGSMAPWMQAMQAPWSNMNQYANVIGRPTVLGSSQQSGSGSSKGGGASIG